MLLRNRELALQVLMSLLVMGAAALGAFALGGRAAGFATLAGSGIVVLVATCFTLVRYRRLAELARQVDDVLSGERDVSFDDMSEGELSILASQLSKTLSRLQVANDELESEKRSLADSLADISHQLRTPLTSLGLELALIRREATTESQLIRLRDADRLLARVQWLVSSLLKLARFDAGVVKLASRTVKVGDLVSAAFEPLAVSFDLADVEFGMDVEPQVCFEGDASWTREALSNILKNCLEHTPAGGTVHVRAYEDAVACRIRIEDSGAGISEKDLPHVFERFYRGGDEGASSDVSPAGVGIGLALAQTLVVAQGGSISASNIINDGVVCGARFDISFFKFIV